MAQRSNKVAASQQLSVNVMHVKGYRAISNEKYCSYELILSLQTKV